MTPAPRERPSAAQLTQAARAAGLDVTWLGHSTVVLDLAGTRILADPLLRRHNPPLRRRGGTAPRAPAWQGTDAVLLSHLHHDHADLPSLRMLPDVPVYTAPALVRWLSRRRLAGIGIENGEWVTLSAQGPVEVTTVPAEHHSRPMPHRPNAATGHLVRGPFGTVWLAGDTSLYEGMAALPALAGGHIDLAVVPIGGWGARLSAGHMGPADAATACAAVGARAALPVHWGTLYAPWLPDIPRGWMDRPGPAFARELRASAPECTLVDLDVGASAHIAPGSPGAGEARR